VHSKTRMASADLLALFWEKFGCLMIPSPKVARAKVLGALASDIGPDPEPQSHVARGG
jgi:hypothetical protein